MFDDGYGLGDEELMTVQGFDGYDGYGDYGALYQAPDGTVYQVQGLGQAPSAQGACVPGEVRQGADGQLYQYVEGYDGLGNPVGIWSLIPAIAKAVLPMASQILPKIFGAGGGGGAGQIIQRLPQAASMFSPPGAPPGMPTAATSDELTGFGALYQAPDGSYVQVQGPEEDMQGPDDEILRGYGADEPGYGADEPLSDDEVLRGYADDGERLGDDAELRDADGYAPEETMGDTEGYVPEQGPRTRAFRRPARPPVMWRPLW